MVIRFILMLICSVQVFECFGDQYPKSKLERELDEIGSVMNNDTSIKSNFSGISNLKSDHSKPCTIKVNKYLYEAAKNYLSFTKLLPSHEIGEIMTTQWYYPDDEPGISLQIKIILQSSKIHDDSISVFVYERKKMKNGNWSTAIKNESLSNKIKDTILNDARNRYLSNTNKRSS